MLRRLKNGETRELTKTELSDSVSWFTSHMSQQNKEKTLVFVTEVLNAEVGKIVVSREYTFDELSNTHSDNYYFHTTDLKTNQYIWLRFTNISDLPRRNPIFGFVVNRQVMEGVYKNVKRGKVIGL